MLGFVCRDFLSVQKVLGAVWPSGLEALSGTHSLYRLKERLDTHAGVLATGLHSLQGKALQDLSFPKAPLPEEAQASFSFSWLAELVVRLGFVWDFPAHGETEHITIS